MKFAILWLSTLAVYGQCGNRIAMQGYAACVPADWFVERQSDNRLYACSTSLGSACNAPGRGGFPAIGIVQIMVRPVTKATFVAKGQAVELAVPGATCSLDRYLQDDLWTDEYHLAIGARFFRIFVEYWNDPGAFERYRASGLQIVQSLMPDPSSPAR